MFGVGDEGVIGERDGVQTFFEAETGALVVGDLVTRDGDAAGGTDDETAEEVAGDGVFEDATGASGIDDETELTVVDELVIFESDERLGIIGVDPVAAVAFGAVVDGDEGGTIP